MIHTHTALIEIGTEELPPKNLLSLSTSFADNVRQGLTEAELSFSEIQAFATPRRLALRILGLNAQQPDRIRIKRGPAKQNAFDADGNPVQATLKFAESCGVSVQELSLQETPKGSWLIFEQKESGQSAAALLPDIVQQALDQLPIAKRMRWANIQEAFVRPVQWVVLMLDNTVIPGEFFGIQTGNITYGHRFHCPQPIVITDPMQYEQLLLNPGHVIANFTQRRDSIRTQIEACCAKNASEALLEETLLHEVTGLVEWPVVLMGSFEPAFLDIPHEALISAMQVHQKCFAVCTLEPNRPLAPKFIITSNIKSSDPASIIKGNESVMHARLADAAFHYHTDKKTRLEERLPALQNVVFQAGLGSLADKVQRLAALCSLPDSKRAAFLSKADLLSNMVGEFPELQGIMGQYYALDNGESKTVAEAIEAHYHPRFANDTLPNTPEGCELAIADRVDTLVGLFGINKIPTGDKDPFALRRQALGLMRIIIEKQLDLDLRDLFTTAAQAYGPLLKQDPTVTLLNFCFERLRSWYQEQNIGTREFEAVKSIYQTQRPLIKPYDFHCRLLAVHHFQTLPEAQSLAAAYKRVKNILDKNPNSEILTFRTEKLEAPAEKALGYFILDKEDELKPLIEQAKYTQALQTLASLKGPVDRFFTEVMVMVEDETLRNNRIALLRHLRDLFLEIADISEL